MNSRRKLDLREVSKEEKRFVINARKHANQLKNEPVIHAKKNFQFILFNYIFFL